MSVYQYRHGEFRELWLCLDYSKLDPGWLDSVRKRMRSRHLSAYHREAARACIYNAKLYAGKWVRTHA